MFGNLVIHIPRGALRAAAVMKAPTVADFATTHTQVVFHLTLVLTRLESRVIMGLGFRAEGEGKNDTDDETEEKIAHDILPFRLVCLSTS